MEYFKRIMGPISPSDRTEAIQPEHVRRAAMNEYADIQIFKLKFLIGLLAIIALTKL